MELQNHISTSILEMPDKLEGLKQIQSFLGKLNYARNFNPNLGQITRPLYNKSKQIRERRFNNEDIKVVQKIKDTVRKIKLLELPPHNAYLIIESDGKIRGWGGVLY